MAHIQEELEWPQRAQDHIPTIIEQIVKKMLEKSADDRYQTMGEVIDVLERAQDIFAKR